MERERIEPSSPLSLAEASDGGESVAEAPPKRCPPNPYVRWSLVYGVHVYLRQVYDMYFSSPVIFVICSCCGWDLMCLCLFISCWRKAYCTSR